MNDDPFRSPVMWLFFPLVGVLVAAGCAVLAGAAHLAAWLTGARPRA